MAAASGSPTAAAAEFLAAFNALDQTRFDALFAEDATLFYPSAPFPLQRVEGKAAVTGWFSKFFDAVRKRGAKNLNINPSDLHAQTYGDTAVVTFHLNGGSDGAIGRRTVVLNKRGGRWLIVHLHASAARPKPQGERG